MNDQERKAFHISNKPKIIKYSLLGLGFIIYLILILILSDIVYTSNTFSKTEFK